MTLASETAEAFKQTKAPIAELAKAFARAILEYDKHIHDTLSGKKAIVISNYNGQEFGRSRKSWKGREVTIDHAFYSGHGNNPRITVWLKEERSGGGSAALGLEELEVLE